MRQAPLICRTSILAELATINDRVEAIDTEIKALAKADADMRRVPRCLGPDPASCIWCAIP
ncbi:hypothetical protein HGG71_07165 [Rhodobacteraceae bacterium R_SAG2]|nr:hypothetical protein [Rhodobacteraceae bacterium R_SAG2]